MSKLGLFALAFVLTILSSCDSKRDSAAEKVDTYRGCVPESELQGIVGGEIVRENSYDSNRVVMILSNISEGSELCTAAPIASDVLLTAAHCIKADAANTKVFAKAGYTCESGFNYSRDARDVSAIAVHENYRDIDLNGLAGVKSDIALIFLKQPLPAHYPVYKIASPDLLNQTSLLYLYGYGRKSLFKSNAGLLRKTQIQRQNFSLKSQISELRIDQTLGFGVCSGDSGGPGLIEAEGELQIIGVNSYVSGPEKEDLCAYDGNLALADHYRTWIERKMNVRGRSLRK